MNFFNKIALTTALTTMFIASAAHAMEDENPRPVLSATVRHNNSSITVEINEDNATVNATGLQDILNIFQGPKEESTQLAQSALAQPDVQNLITTIFGAQKLNRFQEKAARSALRREQEQANFEKYGRRERNSVIEKLIAKGELERK